MSVMIQPSDFRELLELMRKGEGYAGLLASINGAEPVPAWVRLDTDHNDYGDGVWREGRTSWSLSITGGIEPTFDPIDVRMGAKPDELVFSGKALWRAAEIDVAGNCRTELLGSSGIEYDTPVNPT